MQPDHNQDITKLSTTNFDLPSLHLLLPEIEVALKDAETHLSEFNDDEEQAPLLLDSIEVLKQLAAVLDLICLDGASDLAENISASLQKLYDEGDNTNDALILDVSEAIMTLDRYVEFVLLNETLAPALLIPVLNRINATLGRNNITEESFNKRTNNNISIANPEANYQSLKTTSMDAETLSTAYRSGLSVILSKRNSTLNDSESRKIEAMAAACHIASKRTQSLFWLAAEAATKDLASIIPLSSTQKRTLIFLEQQFHDYLPASDKRFADLVSFAQDRNHSLALQLKAKFSSNRLNDTQQQQMKRFLFGPDREVTSVLNQLIQDEINIVKDKVDAFVRGSNANPAQSDIKQIVERLHTLSLVTSTLQLSKASKAFTTAAAAVKNWTSPTSENFDDLLSALMVGENDAIHLAKSHEPGSINLPLHDNDISLYQLDTAYDTLVKEGRTTISNIEQAMNSYVVDQDLEHISNVPTMVRQVAGAVRFLEINDGANMLTRLAKYLDNKVNVEAGSIDMATLDNIANVIIAIDYHLEGFERKNPVGKQAMTIGHHSLNELIAA